jgi:hypothetical protein
MDFAEEELKLEHLAVRFKLEETMQEFKKVFEKCQADLREKGSPTKPVTTSPINFTGSNSSNSLHIGNNFQ